MNHSNRTVRQLWLLVMVAASQAGCLDTIEVFPDGGIDPGSDATDPAGNPDAAPKDADESLPDASESLPDSAVEADASAPVDGGTCTLRPGGRELSPCKRAYQVCAINGPVFAEATFIGCSDERGVGGNPLITVSTCEQALLGDSGQTCGTDLSCRGASADTCCVRHAECAKDAPLVLAEVCVASCERTPVLSGPTVHDCEEVAAVEAEPDRAYGSASRLPNLVGLPCVGEFECGPESSYGFSVFCGAGRLQLLTLGPNGFRSL